MIYEVEGGVGGVGLTQESRAACQWEALCGVPTSLSIFPGPPEDSHQGLLSTNERRNSGRSLCSSPRYHLSISVGHYWKQNNTDRISHPSLGYENHKDAGIQTSPPASPSPHTTHPRLVAALLSLPTSNWLTPDPHGCFIFWAHKATWDQLICVGKWQPCCLHLLCLSEAPLFVPFPLCATLLCFNSSRKEVKVASIHCEHIQKDKAREFPCNCFPCKSCPVAYFNSK